MEVSNVDKRSFLVTFNGTEFRFLNELAAEGDSKVEKTIADLTFISIINAHAQMRIDQMMKTHDEWWEH